VVRNSFLREQSEIIQDVQKAEVRITRIRGEGKIKTYRYNYQIFLVTKNGLYTLFYPEDSFEPQNTAIFKSEVSQLNNFINNSDEKSIKIEEREYALSSIKRGIFLLFVGWLPLIIFLVYFYIVLITLKPTGRKS
jgi:ATP-dependent Zn protease